MEFDREEASRVVIEENQRTAEALGINPAARTTCIKPEGTASCVLGTSSGISAWHSKYYIRRLINCIYADAQKQKLQESEVIADYTGATKGMTAGIILACTNSNRRLQYISQIPPCPIIEVRIS